MTKIEKSAPAEGDVHVPAAGDKKDKKKSRTFKDMWTDMTKSFAKSKDDVVGEKVEIESEIIKMDDEQQMVTGWASVIEKNGIPVVDHQDDIITVDELTKAAHNFMSDYRVGKAMHDGGKVGEVVESVVFTKELQKALGIDLGKVGWLIKVKVTNPKVWAQVKKGELKAFSVGGTGVRTPV